MPNRLFQPLPLHPCCLLTELLLVPGARVESQLHIQMNQWIDPCANRFEKKKKESKTRNNANLAPLLARSPRIP